MPIEPQCALSTRKSRTYVRTTIRMCETPTMARSIATLLVLCCLDGCVGLVSDSGYARFCFLVLCLYFSCCMCALISLPLTLVVRTCVCGVVFMLCLRNDWGMVPCTECVCKSTRVCSCRMVLSDSQKVPTQPHFELVSSPPPARFTPFQRR